jgi:hypothetical protein
VKHYLRQGTAWIICFDDEAKKFELFLRGETDIYDEFQEIEVVNSLETFEETDGRLFKCGNCKFMNYEKGKLPVEDTDSNNQHDT